MKNISNHIVNKFKVFGPEGMQFSAVAFSAEVKEHFPLNRYRSIKSLQQGIDDIKPNYGGTTRIWLGLKVSQIKPALF